jgi:hypothetical protein
MLDTQFPVHYVGFWIYYCLLLRIDSVPWSAGVKYQNM